MSRWHCLLGGAALALATGGNATAMDASANAGLGLGRWDYWAADAHTATTVPDWQLMANLAGQPFRPGLFEWQAGAGYSALHNYAPAQDSSRSAWTYRLSSSLLSTSNVPLTFQAARTISTFSTDTTAVGSGLALTQTGTTETNIVGGSVTLRGVALPTLRLQGTMVDNTNTPIGGTAISQDAKIVNVGVNHSLGKQTYSVDYSSTWNGGNYSLNNYRSDYLNAQFISNPLPDLLVRFRDYYVLRSPRNDAALNPRYDDNAITTGALYRPGRRWSMSFDYTYRHSLVSATGAPTSEATTHAFTETTTLHVRPDLYFYGTAGGGYALQTQDQTTMRAGNENLGLGMNAQETRGRNTFITAANSQLVALETAGKPATLGYLVAGSQSIRHARERSSHSLTYSISYGSNAVGIGGSTLVQSVYGNTYASLGYTLQCAGTLSYTETRRNDPLFGEFRNRTVNLRGHAAWRWWRNPYTVDVNLGATDGLAGGVAQPVGAPLPTILPPEYNTQSKFVTLQATQSFFRGRLTLAEFGRLMSLQMPQQPSQYEESAWITLRYAMGLMYLSLEDRLSRGGTNSPAQTSNLLLLRLTRAFGAHF